MTLSLVHIDLFEAYSILMFYIHLHKLFGLRELTMRGFLLNAHKLLTLDLVKTNPDFCDRLMDSVFSVW